MARRGATAVALAAMMAAGGACGDAPAPPPQAAPSTTLAAASTLPPGHPPVAGMGGAAGAMGGHGRAPAGKGGLTWDDPAGWLQEAPASPMRRAQYRVAGPGGDAECVVFYFGAGEGGDPQANAERWAAQFTQPGGKPAALETRPLEVPGVKVLVVEAAGTYHGGPTMGAAAPPGPRPEYMLLGAIAQGPDANWFFKFTGPERTVRAHRAAFEGMLRSLRKAEAQAARP
jgi:hypothetical protein